MWDKSLTDVFLLGKVVCKEKLLALQILMYCYWNRPWEVIQMW